MPVGRAYEHLMPQPTNCDQCGAPAMVHSVQYIYKKRLTKDLQTDHDLTMIVALIECPKCGVRSQTTKVESEER